MGQDDPTQAFQRIGRPGGFVGTRPSEARTEFIPPVRYPLPPARTTRHRPITKQGKCNYCGRMRHIRETAKTVVAMTFAVSALVSLVAMIIVGVVLVLGGMK